MTTDRKELCEKLARRFEQFVGYVDARGPAAWEMDAARNLIEAQAKQIAGLERKHKEAFDDCGELNTANHELLAACGEKDRRIAELEADRDSWRDQCSQRVKDWHEEHERVKALEAKCALMAASLAQAEREKDDAEKHAAEVSNANFEFEAKVAAAEKATRFAGLVLAQHRNDGYPGDVDGDDLQRFALESGMIEERLVESSCGSECSCADVGEFPTTCYFNTEAGKAAIAASKEQS